MPETFRAGARVTHQQKDCRTLVRIVDVAEVLRITYPIVAPMAHTRGRSPDTWALFVESVSSPIMLLATPMFPLSKPAIHRLSERSARSNCGDNHQVPHYEAGEGFGQTETDHGYYKSGHTLERNISRHKQRLQSCGHLPSSAPASGQCDLKGGST